MSQQRRAARQTAQPIIRDRIEEADHEFFARVAHGYENILRAEPNRVRSIDATRTTKHVETEIWRVVQALLRD